MDKKDIEAVFPLSHQQKGMFLETLLAPGSGIHIEQFLWAFQGVLDVPLFKQAWQSVIQRHAMLRTVFISKDRPEPLQVTLRSIEMPFEQYNLSEQVPAEQERQIADILRAERQKGFDLSRAPLMRLGLFQTGAASYQIAWTIHHILMDGWCNHLVFQDVVTFYQGLVAGQKVSLPPSPSYREYVIWLKQQDMLRAEKFWRETMQGVTRPTLPGKMSDSDDGFDAEVEIYGTQKMHLSAEDTLALTALSQRRHVTLNTLLQGAWALMLSRYSGDDDVVLGTTVSGRPPNLPGSETMVGLFINTLPLRVRVRPNEGLWPWLERIQAQHLDLRNYEYCSTGQVHQWSNMPGNQPLFESIVVFENYPTGGASSNISGAAAPAGDVQMKDQVGAQTNYALTLLALPGTELELQLVLDKRRFVPGSVTKILEHCTMLLRSFLSAKDVSLSVLLDAIPVEQVPYLRPLPGARQMRDETVFDAPNTPTEKKLAGLYEKLFSIEQIGRDEGFFSSGGHSMQALQLVRRVQDAFQVDIPLLALFESPTIADLAQRIEEAQASAQEAKRNLITPVARDGKLSLSTSQQALWACLQMARPSDKSTPFWKGWATGRKSGMENTWQEVHPLVAVVRLNGKLNQDALAESLKLLCERHEMLRTRFVIQDRQMFQEIQENAAQIHFQVIEKPTFSADAAKSMVLNLIQEERQRLFDFGGALSQAILVRLAEQAHVLVFTFHPLIADAPSARLMMGDLATFYAGIVSGEPAKLPKLSVQYVDYAAWQESSLGKDVLQQQLDYWKQSLNGYKPLFPVKISKNTGEPRSQHAFSSDFALSREQVDGLEALGQQQSVPWVFTLTAAFQVLLYLCTGDEDIAVALPVPHRSHRDVANVVGPFANYLTLCALFSDETSFLDVLAETRNTITSIFANQDIPFETVAAELALKNSQPAQVMFALDDKPGNMTWSSELTCSDVDVIGNESNFELCLLLQQSDAGLSGRISYNPKQFDRATIEYFVNDYCALVKNILNAPQSPVSTLALASKP